MSPGWLKEEDSNDNHRHLRLTGLIGWCASAPGHPGWVWGGPGRPLGRVPSVSPSLGWLLGSGSCETWVVRLLSDTAWQCVCGSGVVASEDEGVRA